MALNFKDYSIKTKVLLPTTIILFSILITYTFVFSQLFITVKSDSFSDHKILSQINDQIYNIRIEGDGVSAEQLNKLNHLASNYLALVIEIDGKEEEEEFLAAQNINNNSKNYTQAYHLWLSQHAHTQVHKLPDTLVSFEKKLLASITVAKEIVQEEAEEDLESLLQYEVISSIIIYCIILIYVAYGIQLVVRPLVKLREEINSFNNYSPEEKKIKGDEITNLENSFNQMRIDIVKSQRLLEQTLAKAEQANAAKTEFLANISHELRTPMLGILGFAELGINKVEDVDRTKLLKYFSRIHTSGSRLLLLLNNLLDLSKLEANQVTFDIKKCCLNEVLDQVTTELLPLINSKSLQLKIITDKPKFTAEFDNQRIHQVIYNLLSNAIKFSPEEGIINISFIDDVIKTNDLEVPAIKFTIKDQGIGIPEAELEIIFDKFSQSSRTNTGAGGTGLGLSISKDICNYHHGKLWAENLAQPEQGAKFTLVLPKISLTT